MANLVLSCIYGDKHLSFVHTFLYSVIDSSPDTGVVIGYCDFPEIELKLLQIAYPDVVFVKLQMDHRSISTHAARASKKTFLWQELFENQVSMGDNAIFMDIDTIMVDAPFDAFNDIADLGLTRKPGKWPLNSGVMFVKKSQSTSDLFCLWSEKTEEIIDSKHLNRESERLSGGADQRALLELLGIEDSLKDFSIEFVQSRNFDLNIKFLDCSVYNQTESVPFDEVVKIIHFKAGWHDILLTNSRYTGNRPASTSREFHSIWQGYYARSKLHLYKSIHEIVWRENETKLKIMSIPYEERGIYNSELVLICSMMKLLGLNIVLESGRARGHSTYVLSEFFKDDLNSKVISVDFERNDDTAFAESRLAKYPRVSLSYGHAGTLLGSLIENEIPKNSKYMVLLDGPKSLNALYLTGKLIRNKRPPSLIFIHDMSRLVGGDKPSFQRFLCQTLVDRVFFSDDFHVTSPAISCDESVFAQKAASKKYRNQPFMKSFLPTGSYGPTLAVILPTRRDLKVVKSLISWPISIAVSSWRQIFRFLIQGQLFRLCSFLSARSVRWFA